MDVRPLETTEVDSLTNRFADKSVPYQVKRIGTVIVPTAVSYTHLDVYKRQTVICTDKTGTLTQNLMQVHEPNFYGLKNNGQLGDVYKRQAWAYLSCVAKAV